ncbi:MAG: hypothetical protein K0V04_24760 [Deltaproteobacteria bacterium]|nr:hypothetical protein [Deltaproteobacteria bacterium]
MKDVFIYGDDDGAIRWTDDAAVEPSTTPTRFATEVRYQQHPRSPQDVFVAGSSNNELYFTLEGGGTELKTSAVAMRPPAGQSVVLEQDPTSSSSTAGAHQGKRWHSGYVPT